MRRSLRESLAHNAGPATAQLAGSTLNVTALTSLNMQPVAWRPTVHTAGHAARNNLESNFVEEGL